MYEELCAAIVERAVIDYKSALAGKNMTEIRQLKKFFRSDWFDFLSELNGEVLMAQVERMVQK